MKGKVKKKISLSSVKAISHCCGCKRGLETFVELPLTRIIFVVDICKILYSLTTLLVCILYMVVLVEKE
jgi:hypothetical protein